MRHPLRAPMPRRTRRRWTVAAGVAACWSLLVAITGSLVAGTALLLFVLALTAGCVAGLRAMGISGTHPWVQQLRSRPWRDGREVLQLGLRHLPEVFVITPSGSLLAPNSVELRLNPDDFSSLCELMEPGLVNASATEVYQEQVAAHGARLARPGAGEVHVTADHSVPAGRYRLRQARPLPGAPAAPLDPAQPQHARPLAGAPAVPLDPAQPRQEYQVGAGNWPFARDGGTRAVPVSAGAVTTGLTTVAERTERPVPALRLVTGERVVETRTSGALAGRGEVELVLPGVATISREHARFTCAGGAWSVTNLGRNGLAVNGVPLTGTQVVRDGDSITWGSNAGAPQSRVEIG